MRVFDEKTTRQKLKHLIRSIYVLLATDETVIIVLAEKTTGKTIFQQIFMISNSATVKKTEIALANRRWVQSIAQLPIGTIRTHMYHINSTQEKKGWKQLPKPGKHLKIWLFNSNFSFPI